MRPRSGIAVLAITILVAACQRSSEQEASESAKAAALAEAKADQARRELESGNARAASRSLTESQQAAATAVRRAATAAKALTREHERYHVLLTKEIVWIDRRIKDLEASAPSTNGTLRIEKEIEIAAHRTWRDRLNEDLTQVDRAPSGDEWTTLKTKIDHDLDLNRPASIPRSYEIPYGI